MDFRVNAQEVIRHIKMPQKKVFISNLTILSPSISLKMKTPAIFTSLLSAVLFFTLSTTALAQKVATWKGGTPGQAAEWNCPANWKEGQVPNEFSQVIIPDVSTSTFNNPVLASGEVEVWSIQIYSGASLRIGKNARLIALEQEELGTLAWGEGVLRPGTPPNTVDFASK